MWLKIGATTRDGTTVPTFLNPALRIRAFNCDSRKNNYKRHKQTNGRTTERFGKFVCKYLNRVRHVTDGLRSRVVAAAIVSCSASSRKTGGRKMRGNEVSRTNERTKKNWRVVEQINRRRVRGRTDDGRNVVRERRRKSPAWRDARARAWRSL